MLRTRQELEGEEDEEEEELLEIELGSPEDLELRQVTKVVWKVRPADRAFERWLTYL